MTDKWEKEFDKTFYEDFTIVYNSPVGAICSYSEDWLVLNPKSDSTRIGKIVGESRDKKYWWILWDGLRTKDCYSKKFIKRVDDIESRLKVFIKNLIQQTKERSYDNGYRDGKNNQPKGININR